MQLDRNHASAAPAVTLKAFLKSKRDKLRPESVGLPRRTSTRSIGLRREDIAELLGVSPLWYSLFESGTSRRRFSAAFLRRVQDALQLDASDYQTLLGLTVASKIAAPELEVQWYSTRWSILIDFVADAERRIANAPPESGSEIARMSMRAVLDQLSLVDPGVISPARIA